MKSRFCRLFAFFCLFSITLSTLSAPNARAEIIRSFHADVRLLPNSTLDVSETIIWDPQGAQRRGIFRDIPTRYDRHGGRYSIHVKVQSVTNESGRKWAYKLMGEGGNLRIRIGDPDVFVSGEQTYKIRYLVRRAINYFDGGQPEVYWNVTGNEWPFDMQRVTARFYPPAGVTLNEIRTGSFIGPPGSTREGKTTLSTNHILFSGGGLDAGDGLTILARLPSGSVTMPSPLQALLWWLADWWATVMIPLLALGGVGLRWAAAGRDEGNLGAIPVEWNPPTNLSPAEVGTLVDERCDMADIVSTLIDLAARGYLIIEEIESEHFLFFSKKDYRFIQQKDVHDPAPHPLEPHEAKFLKGIFASGSSVTLSGLKEKFYTHLPGIRHDIYHSLTHKKLFVSNPDTTRQTFYGLGIAMLIGGVLAGFFGAEFGLIAWGIGLFLAGGIVWLSARAMPAKTHAGTKALRQCLAFQRYVRMAEKRRIEELAKEDPTIFGRLLPYAIVLGVADQWADAFKDLLTEPPDWYHSPYGYNNFSSRMFVHELGHGMNTMGSTLQSTPPPKSTAGGGGSGFSSGGGFSGGGFGGGGGGSW